MIDRSYLPFESARHYQDRKMQKWMGFFLSEHTSALSDDLNKISLISELTLEQKLLLISQAYTNHLTVGLQTFDGKQLQTLVGTITTISREQVIIRTSDGHTNVPLSILHSIEAVEEVRYESA
ncbi:TPA: hypothetical protein ACU0L4_002323 [Streptococcus suis]|uniref:hypothetical protein n=1 Tax=Streptococcus entericus TaxID=155680 RepID=UPI0003625095|nr:hypothetical protein [Streptococcus entericus]